jgi:hypothetical protein
VCVRARFAAVLAPSVNKWVKTSEKDKLKNAWVRLIYL